MAFGSLSEKLNQVFKKLRGKGKLSEADIKEAMREVKLALLEADVNFKVVKEFVRRVSEKAVGVEVLESLTPAQQVINRQRRAVRDHGRHPEQNPDELQAPYDCDDGGPAGRR